jgi:hypothetical protein
MKPMNKIPLISNSLLDFRTLYCKIRAVDTSFCALLCDEAYMKATFATLLLQQVQDSPWDGLASLYTYLIPYLNKSPRYKQLTLRHESSIAGLEPSV